MHTDRRVRRTNTALAQAIIALAKDKPYSEITIRDITTVADIGYATFFRHYTDKDSLLISVLDDTIEQIAAVLRVPGPYIDPEQLSLLLFTYVDQHQDLCRLLINAMHVDYLGQKVIDRGIELLRASFAHVTLDLATMPIPIAILMHHVVVTTFSLCGWYLFRNNQQVTVKQMSDYYNAIVVRPFLHHLNLNRTATEPEHPAEPDGPATPSTR